MGKKRGGGVGRWRTGEKAEGKTTGRGQSDPWGVRWRGVGVERDWEKDGRGGHGNFARLGKSNPTAALAAHAQ